MPGPLGIGGSGPGVGAVDAPDGRRRQHRPKLTIFSPYGRASPRSTHPYRCGSPSGSRVGRVGRPARCPIRATTTPPSALLRLVGLTLAVGARSGRRSGSSCWRPGWRDVHPAIPAMLWGALLVTGSVLWAWWGVLFLSYELGRPLLPERLAERGPFPQADAAHLPGGGPVRPARLGGECGGEGLQRAGADAGAKGWAGRAAAYSSLAASPRRHSDGVLGSPGSTGCRFSSPRGVSWPAG